MQAEWESRQLMSILLSKIPLRHVTLVDAGFIWTESHSMRIKVKLTIQKEVMNRIQLRHTFPVEFVIAGQQCEDCARSFTEHTWRAIVQVRQRVPHKKTFLYLEQLILKHSAHEHATNMAQQPDGVDFQFMERSHAAKFVDFLQSVVPCGYKTSKQLVSSDTHTATYNYKYTFLVTIVPLCRDDLVLLPPVTQSALGLPSPLALVYRVSNFVYMVDPSTITTAEMNYERYNKAPFKAAAKRRKRVSRRKKGRHMATIAEGDDVIFSSHGGADTSSVAGSAARGLAGDGTVASRAASAIASLASGKKFSKNMGLAMARSVASSGLVSGRSSVATTVSGGPRGRYLLADVTIGPDDDSADVGDYITVRSHLGHVLKPGDIALGLDLKHAVYVDEHEEDPMQRGKKGKGPRGAGAKQALRDKDSLPDVVLVRKYYEPRQKVRKWKLKSLGMPAPEVTKPGDLDKEAREREEFLQELEDDRKLRATINLYRDLQVGDGSSMAGHVSSRPGAVLGADIQPSAHAAPVAAGGAGGSPSAGDGSSDDEEDGGLTLSAVPDPAGMLAAGKLQDALAKAPAHFSQTHAGGTPPGSSRGSKRRAEGSMVAAATAAAVSPSGA
ncbi:NMD3, partial [Symbiodinium sp. KB8]